MLHLSRVLLFSGGCLHVTLVKGTLIQVRVFTCYFAPGSTYSGEGAYMLHWSRGLLFRGECSHVTLVNVVGTFK